MRSVPLLLVALLAATPCVSATFNSENEVHGLIAVQRDDTVMLAWQPTPGATQYGIYRETAAGADEYVFLGSTRSLFFIDNAAPGDGANYVVVVLHQAPLPGPADAGTTPQKGSCVRASASGASVTASNCVPQSAEGSLDV